MYFMQLDKCDKCTCSQSSYVYSQILADLTATYTSQHLPTVLLKYIEHLPGKPNQTNSLPATLPAPRQQACEHLPTSPQPGHTYASQGEHPEEKKDTLCK